MILAAIYLAVAPVVTEPTRTNAQMCAEVQYELNLHVERGMISQEKADKASARCYEVFVNDK